MNAVQLLGHGGPDQLVHSHDVPTPDPAPGEVLIDVYACGMNNTDVWVRQGAYGSDTDPTAVSSWRRGHSTLEFPRIKGTDIDGRIVAVGDSVPGDRIGQRVMVDFSIYNRPEGDESLADIDYIGHAPASAAPSTTHCPAPARNKPCARSVPRRSSSTTRTISWARWRGTSTARSTWWAIWSRARCSTTC